MLSLPKAPEMCTSPAVPAAAPIALSARKEAPNSRPVSVDPKKVKIRRARLVKVVSSPAPTTKSFTIPMRASPETVMSAAAIPAVAAKMVVERRIFFMANPFG